MQMEKKLCGNQVKKLDKVAKIIKERDLHG
jgi:hypothetical protein